jgi:predicted metal-binding membrane protein
MFPVLAVCTLLFAVSAMLTIVWCAPMAAMGMPMPGGWTMSMAWMRMPGQTWLGAGAVFVGMWAVMMVAMMMPVLTPVLLRYRQAMVDVGQARPGWRTALAGVAYFVVWIAFGVVVYPLGVVLAEIEMRQPALARAVPIAVAIVVVIAIAVQFTAWKAHQLACRSSAFARVKRGASFGGTAEAGAGRALPVDSLAAFRSGLRFGLHCTLCCANWMAILLVCGVMDLWVMAVVTAAITRERWASREEPLRGAGTQPGRRTTRERSAATRTPRSLPALSRRCTNLAQR